MKILVDGRTWSLYGAGISTFFTSAIQEWARQKKDDVFYIILPKGIDPRVELSPLPENIILLDYSKRFHSKIPNIIILQVLVPYLCRKLHIELYYSPVPHLPFFFPLYTHTMVTIHDVVNIEMSHTMAWTNRVATSFFFGYAIRNADYLWANSHYTRSKVEEYFPQRRRQNIFVGGAVDRHIFHPRQLSEEEKEDIKKRHDISHPFILFVGSLEPRKNLQFLLRIIPNLYRQYGIQMVVVGGKGWKNSDIKDIVESDIFPRESTVFCGYISNAELARLYCCAECFVSASLMEGLGMPQIEALLCGCPIVTAHNTAMIEVAKDKEGAISIKDYNPEEWQQAILNMIHSPRRVRQEQLNAYDWARVISGLLELLSNTRS